MKVKTPKLILALILAALLCAALVACDLNKPATPDNKPQDFETAKFTVTYDTNGGTQLTNSKWSDVPYGTKVQPPKNSNGEVITPIKAGYIFDYWEYNSNKVDFETLTVTSNMTLKARYKSLEYKHEPKLRAKLVYSQEDGTFSIAEDARPQDEVGMSAAELNKDTTHLRSIYDVTSSDLPCPTIGDGSGVQFCFWYYIENGKPVRFTSWKKSGESTVTMLSKYTRTSALTLYPMFEDNLPTVTVKYADSISDATYGEQKDYDFGKNIPSTDKFVPVKSGYSFDYWYFIMTEETNGEKVKRNVEFVFDADNEKNPTSPMEAADANDDFTPVTLTLYAKWTKEITIASVDDFRAVYDALRVTTPNDEQKSEIEQILSANINFVGTVDFGTEHFEPLFDEKHAFKGKIDGGVYNPNTNALVSRATIKGGLFGKTTDASVFGYNEGRIENIVFDNVGLRIEESNGTGVYENYVYIGTVTTRNSGTIEGCTVTHSGLTISGLHNVTFGGVSALNRATTTLAGVLSKCDVTINNFTANNEALTFGGIVGESNATAVIEYAEVSIDGCTITCRDDGIPSNGRSSLTMGGIAGVNSSSIALSKVSRLVTTNIVSLSEFVFGGVAGTNTGTVQTTYANITLGTEQTPVITGGSRAQITAVGGLVGINERAVKNCYADAAMYINVRTVPQSGTIAAVGGLVGSNYSDKTDSVASQDVGICVINGCYGLGDIVVSVSDGAENVAVNAGGISGRNSHKKVNSVFASVNIEVKNSQTGAANEIGYLFGSFEKESAPANSSKCCYTEDSVLKLNDTAYTFTKDGEGKIENESFKVQRAGTATDAENFRKADWVTGSGTVASYIDFSGTVWEVKDGGYPTFKESIYEQN